MAPMRQIRTTGQCLMAHFQNGPSSADNRRTNSVKRSITSPTGKGLWGDQLRCSRKSLEQESCNGHGPYPAEKADFTPFTFLQTRTNLLSSLLMNSKLDRGKSSAARWFCASADRRFLFLKSDASFERIQIRSSAREEIRTGPGQRPALRRRQSSDAYTRRCLPDHPLDRRLEPGLQPRPAVAFRLALWNQPRAH